MEYHHNWKFAWFICHGQLCLLIFVVAICNTHLSNGSGVEQTNHTSENVALLTIFKKYGINGTLSFEAFEHLLYNLGLGNIAFMDHNVDAHRSNDSSKFAVLHSDHDHSEHSLHNAQPDSQMLTSEEHFDEHYDDEDHSVTEANSSVTQKCLDPVQLLSVNGLEAGHNLTEHDFVRLCPLLILQLDLHTCKQHQHHDDDDHHHHNVSDVNTGSIYSQSASVWGFSLLACLIISAVGLVAVAIIPIMHKVIYNHMLQFLVALAVGSLTGDAVLHLLPHALIPHDEHHSHDDSSHGGHNRHAAWCGLAALGGIYLFFIVERVVGMCSERKRSQNERRLEKLQEVEASGGDASSSLHMMNPSIQPVIAKGPAGHNHLVPDGRTVGIKLSRHTETATSCEEILMMVHTNKDVRKFADDAHDELHQHCDPKVKASTWGHSSSSSNGGHNHSHFVPGSVASVAWMVIVGDGFHNFADGLAIGSAFASSLIGGLSTSIAVFCHELPHELGDFAMLLNAGMSPKQALVYNCVSSVLCLFGMIIGIVVGNVAAATTWIFAVVAGLFLYIALVDMLPELTKMGPKKGEHPLLHLALQNAGMLVGVAIMLLIALFEDEIQHSFSSSSP